MKPSEFDFRVWDSENDVYHYANENRIYLAYPNQISVSAYGFTLKGGETEMSVFYKNSDIFTGELCDSEKIELELWSGFKDCNGNNIYAGDIVKNLETDLTYLVEFYNTHFILSPLKYQHRREFQLSLAIKFFIIAEYAINCEFDFLKILGNIHENPEI